MRDSPLLTLAELAPRLSGTSDGEDVYRTSRRIQNWVTAGLLHPVSGKHSGRGVHRRYDQHEIHKARVLLELVKFQMPSSVLQRVASLFDDLRPESDETGYSGVRAPSPRTRRKLESMRRSLKRAKSGESRVYLIMPPTEKDDFGIQFSSNLKLQDDESSAVVVNLTALLMSPR